MLEKETARIFKGKFDPLALCYISVTPFYAWENTAGGAADWKTTLDYDGFDWAGYAYGFKLGSDKRYLEANGIEVDKNAIFRSFSIPTRRQPPCRNSI